MTSVLPESHLVRVVLRRDFVPSYDEFPFCLPAVRHLDDVGGIRRVTYEETEHFKVTRAFLTQRDKMLRILMESDDAEGTSPENSSCESK